MVKHSKTHVVREWYWQRFSAVLLALLLPITFFFVLCLRAEYISYTQFLHLMQQTPVQIWHSLILLAFAIHLWLGVKVILEDYLSLRWRIPLLAMGSLLLLSLLLGGMKLIWWVGI